MKFYLALAAGSSLAVLARCDAKMLQRISYSTLDLQAPYFTMTTDELGEIDRDVSAGNPMCGLMTSPGWNGGSYSEDVPSSLEFKYLEVRDVMQGPNLFDWTSFEDQLNDSASRSKHLVPRFYLHYPNDDELAVPQYLINQGVVLEGGELDYTNPVLLEAIETFIVEFGSLYDGDQRIAFIQMGLLGKWGEWHGSNDDFLTNEVKATVSEWYLDAFTTTLLQTRYPDDVQSSTTGIHDDSFAYTTLDGAPNGGVEKSWYTWPKIVSLGMHHYPSPYWHTSVMGGETRPELQESIFTPFYDAGSENKQDFNLCVEMTHATYMLHSKAFNGDLSGQVLETTRKASARMGYDFHISLVTATKISEDEIDVGITISQVGVAPFYYPLSLRFQCYGFRLDLPGVHTILNEGDSHVFYVSGVPASQACLSNVQLSLESDRLYPGRPMKFAQGDGFIRLNIPLPDEGSLPPTSTSPMRPTLLSPTDSPTKYPTSSPTKLPVTYDEIITSFTLMDASGSDDKAIAIMNYGDVFDLAAVGYSLSIRADTQEGIWIEDVLFYWDMGAESHWEGSAPWAMNGNAGNDYFPVSYLSFPGNKTVVAVASDTDGTILGELAITFEIEDSSIPVTGILTHGPTSLPTPYSSFSPVAPPTQLPTALPTRLPSIDSTDIPTAFPTITPTPAPTTLPVIATDQPNNDGAITGFALIDASTDSILVSPLRDGAIIDRNVTGLELNIVAETIGQGIAEVIFVFDDRLVRSEKLAPYALGGNADRAYPSFDDLARVGTHHIVATARDRDEIVLFTATLTVEVI